MKTLLMVAGMAGLLLGGASAQTPINAPEQLGTLRLTNVWTYSRPVDLEKWSGLTARAVVVSPDSARTVSLKDQWADDRTNWVDEVVLTAGVASGGEVPMTPSVRVVQFSGTNNTAYVERFVRVKRWWRAGIRADAASSTGTVAISAAPMTQ
jgi:hypothetical protein